ncbi:MAG: hypothetical protein L3J66_11760 [Bacteroidales bacterium]|nr:hypothetical protein [Bacteroidales bacterium]
MLPPHKHLLLRFVPVYFVLLLLMPLRLSGQSGQNPEELKKTYRSPVNDTAKVTLLLQMGR